MTSSIHTLARDHRKTLEAIVEPLALGSLANLLINFAFHPNEVDFDITEFVVACVIAIPIAEFNRRTNKMLQRHFQWTDAPFERALLHFVILAFALCFTLNLLGQTYLVIADKGTFTAREIVIINLVTLTVAVVLTFLRWIIHFQQQWTQTLQKLEHSEETLHALKKEINAPAHIEFQKGQAKLRVNVGNIRLVKLESGIPRVRLPRGETVFYVGTMKQLGSLLPGHLFFPITRHAIIQRDVISRVASASFGKVKVQVNVDGQTDEFMVSRLKAAAFRKWLNSI